MDFDLEFDGDHRKRRRNRTTQSCLNCHTSKRKCDRKRPCQRCIQLGLTGLCVYEVDDPALRDDPNVDETTRLRNRIAELESLVRELRGKPHPRWAEPSFCEGDANEKWHSRSSKRGQPQYQKMRPDGVDERVHASSVASSTSTLVKAEQTVNPSHQQFYRLPPSSSSAYPNTGHLLPQTFSRDRQQSPTDDLCYTSSTSAVTYGDHRHSDAATTSHCDQYGQQPYSRSMTVESDSMQPSCSCLTNPAAGLPLIALTNQLRSALGILRQLPEHNTHHQCIILRRIMELDDLMHGNNPGAVSGSSYDALPTPTETEILSPISTSSHSSMGNAMQEWPTMSTSSGYDSYFSVPQGQHGTYQKSYHMG
ncbi:hypothetical protein BKA93DRAFT_734316 [Sparassis latifolia]